MEVSNGLHAMTAEELARFVLDQQELFILDVRNEEDYRNWRIEGERIKSINLPYFTLLEGVEPALARIPADRPVLVVCAKEGSSKFVAERLVEAGRSPVYYLEGGMKSWSEHLAPVKIGELADGGALYQFVRLGKGCLSYMIVSGEEAAIVDTARMTDVYERFAAELGVKIKHTIDTHLHADHLSGGRKLADRSGAAYWLPLKDATEVIFHYDSLEEGREIVVGDTAIRIHPIHSPGHTIGSTSLLVDERYLLSGDILFVESIGRPDLAGLAEDWVGDLRETLYERYRGLPQDLIVLPAHFGQVSELGEGGKVMARLSDLYRSNPGLNIADEEAFRREVTENLPPQPNAYQAIRQANMGKQTPDEDEQREMEIGPNRCAVHDQ
ncbi:MBL fold metallo-hydrolase [Cohnella nanjingensis]|uniref:MBL fold metallo-hydrolase n=1 Tax=Cohnella nanjingensis TaxID=1387779 RepID=A0A7X0RKU9_9BACL|nr:MBL fold metallo-hydrolase [Cohnella nanjingensis]MBB6669290.1 MBL fold metallo-hydrolase [Cohnella nanjingensis]